MRNLKELPPSSVENLNNFASIEKSETLSMLKGNYIRMKLRQLRNKGERKTSAKPTKSFSFAFFFSEDLL